MGTIIADHSPLLPAMAAAKRACRMRKVERSRIDRKENSASEIPRSIRCGGILAHWGFPSARYRGQEASSAKIGRNLAPCLQSSI
jgi:hypothetical protein